MIIKNGKTISSIYKGSKVIDKIYKGTLVVYESFKNLIASGVPPLTLLNCKGVDLIDYKLYGNSVQKGDNLYNQMTFTNGYILGTKGETNANANYYVSDFTEVIPNATYISKTKHNYYTSIGSLIRCACYDENKNFISFLYEVTRYDLGIYENTFTIPSNAKYMRIAYRVSDTDIEFYQSKPTPEAPIEVESVGERTNNLFQDTYIVRKSNVTYENGVATQVTEDTNQNIYFKLVSYQEFVYVSTINIKPITSVGKVYFNFTKEDTFNRIAFGVNGAKIDSVLYADVSTLENGKTYTLSYNILNIKQGNISWNDIQIQEGEVATDYEPYGYKIPVKVSNDTEEYITNIYLDEPLRKIGDYVDYIDFKNKKVVRTIKEMKLSEKSWNLYYDGNGAIYPEFTTTINEGNKNSDLLGCYSTHFEAKTRMEIWRGAKGISCSDNFVRITQDVDTKWNNSAEEFNNWLKENEVFMIYVNSETTEETIELPNIPTIKGTTILEVDTEIQPSNMEVEYKVKNKGGI